MAVALPMTCLERQKPGLMGFKSGLVRLYWDWGFSAVFDLMAQAYAWLFVLFSTQS
jgi:hypothetical protein